MDSVQVLPVTDNPKILSIIKMRNATDFKLHGIVYSFRKLDRKISDNLFHPRKQAGRQTDTVYVYSETRIVTNGFKAFDERLVIIHTGESCDTFRNVVCVLKDFRMI